MIGPREGYSFAIDRVHYTAWRDGRPFTLPDCWREVEGVAGAVIYAPNGRVVLHSAGSQHARQHHLRIARQARTRAAHRLAVRQYVGR